MTCAASRTRSTPAPERAGAATCYHPCESLHNFSSQERRMRKLIFRMVVCVSLLVILLSTTSRIENASTKPLVPTDSQPPGQMKVRIIIGAMIIDGSGRKAYRANLRIVGDRVAGIGRFAPRRGEAIIDARGLVVAPGFIDIHNHSESGLAREPTAASQVSQGITTLAVGPDGASPWPIADYLAKREQPPAAVNVLAFVGHATLREQV